MEKFGWAQLTIDKELMDARIVRFSDTIGFQSVLRYILGCGIPLNQIKMAEVGCGTGTFSLLFNLLGINTTLIDADDEALDAARAAFALYECNAEYVKASVISEPSGSLLNQFNVVASLGLAEHFIEADRTKCISFHKKLLKIPGCAYISVPNTACPWYWAVRWYRELTGTWTIKLEKPYSYWELLDRAKDIGFTKCNIFSNQPILADIHEYAFGFASAIRRSLPAGIQKPFRRNTPIFNPKSRNLSSSSSMKDHLQTVLENVKKRREVEQKMKIQDHFCSNISLFGHMEND